MRKIITIICTFVLALTLSSCFFERIKIHPNMVEYNENTVLETAKEKYDIKSFIFTNRKIHGETRYDESDQFIVSFRTSSFNSNFINGDNIELAFTSFAGKNGGHDIQGMYYDFLCYVALGLNTEGIAKFIYYNLNLDKDAEIVNTIGCSDYPYDILPTEITNELLTPPNNWGEMNIYMKKHFKDIGTSFNYCKDKLSYGYGDIYNRYVYIEFYRENDEIVYDLIYVEDVYKKTEPKLVYSTSNRYDVIYNYYGQDISKYVEVEYTIEESDTDPNFDLLTGKAIIKPVEGKIIYSQLNVRASFNILKDNKVIIKEDGDLYRFTTEVEKSILIEKIENIDHKKTAKLKCIDFYILYEKESTNNYL
ncbi:MAG: hypothetical protein J1F31_01325 [Erysipelotrichales bacterium]|nr:hypothetical protein [Erysipelotrichales bacterium]